LLVYCESSTAAESKENELCEQFEGQTFDSYEDFQSYRKNYCNRSKQTFVVEDCKKIESTSGTVRAEPATVAATATQSTTTISAGEVPILASTSSPQRTGVVTAPAKLTEMQNITLATRLVTRGRPKGTNKSLNKKYGCKCVSKRKREETPAVDDSIRYICMTDEPDKTKMTGSQIDWVDCARDCRRWFHVVFIPNTADASSYACQFCCRR